MPISRYEIRNEYSLADPELYRAADKDDPEALLEGVAMAGLVGVLRQLGDLAEFAAEIFHNLHEEVMATAARGHGLMSRVQQLETEVPSIERAFLSQINHSSFFYHGGVDWHPNVQIDQNLITHGDLPRFVMDSYEECRPPPRLFLLDKFDVAGAGACLKRYTDPSFFKVETSGMTNADPPREKKIRKAKKKGPRLRNGEPPEVLPTSHAKLHQLFLEERVENISKPTRRAKLKRRLNGFPFESRTGKSYMEKLLNYPSPDNKVVHEVTLNSSHLMLPTFDRNESGLEVVEVTLSPVRDNVGRKRSPPSPDREEIMVSSSVYESSEVAMDDKIYEVPNLYSSVATNGGLSSNVDKVTGEKVIAMDRESNKKGSVTGYQSDEIVSEVDNYVDAPSTIESDTDAESRLRVRSDLNSSHIRNESLISDANDENLQIRSIDSHSTGDSTISDDGIYSSRKGMSTFFDSPSTSAGNPQSERISAKGFSSADTTEADEIVEASSYHKTAADDFPVDQYSEPVVSDDTCPYTDAITTHKSDHEQTTSDKTNSTLDDEEKKSNLVMDPSCSPSVSGSDLQSVDGSQRSSAGEHRVDEPNGESIPRVSTVPCIHSHTEDISDKVTSDLQHGDESDQEEFDVHSQNTDDTPGEMNSSENRSPVKFDDEKVANDFPSDYPDIVQTRDNDKSTVSKEENPANGVDNEDSGVSTDSPNQFPCFMETFLKRKLEETSSVNAETVDVEDNHSDSSIDKQICSENLVVSHLANSTDWPQAGLAAHEGGIIPDEDRTENETSVLATLNEVLESLDTGMTHRVSPNDSEAQESSWSTAGELKGPDVEIDGTKSKGQEVTEISGSADLILPNEVHKLLDESDSEEDKSNTADMASAVPALSDNLIIDYAPSPVGPNKLVEEHIHFSEDSGIIDELEIDQKYLSGSNGESGLVEEVDQTNAATSGSETVSFNSMNNDNPKSEVSGTVPNTHLDLEADHDLKLVHPEIIQPSVEQSLLDKEHEIFQQSVLGNHVLDAPSLPVDYKSEESILQEEIGSLPSQLDQELLHPSEINSGVSPVLPIPNQLMLDHDPLDSISAPSVPFLDKNQVNLADLPPLPPLPPVQWMMTGKLQNAPSSAEGEMVKHKDLFPELISQPIVSTDDASSCPRTTSTSDDRPLVEEMKHSLIQIASEPTSKEEKVESSCVEANGMHETIDLPPKSENKQKQLPTSTPESIITSPAEGDGVANGSQTLKLPRPRNPLIDEVAALDKSKLRKVTERDRSQVQKADERDSLLEQIRTKSFNLKPALASRPSLRGPNTNLRVAAILEKANAIRQAFAGSDEDDDDSWSDS